DISLKVDVASHLHTSEPFAMDAGQSVTISVPVGGYATLLDMEDITTTIEITPNAGETVRIRRTSQIAVEDGMMVLRILNEEFTKGATGTVRFTLENTGEEEIEILSATNSGNSSSSQITWYVMDEDDNIITTAKYKQTVGSEIVALSNGNTVARIPAGQIFSSGPTTLTLPATTPDNVTVLLDLSSIYYHHGKTEQVQMGGLSTTHDVTLVETSYYGGITDITPQVSRGDEDIEITGQALDRSDDQPLSGVPLNLVITVNGFERSYEVYTEDDGSFTYTFTPLANEAGIYSVRAVHPDLKDRPVHGQFTITRLTVSPAQINLNITRNYEQTINVQVSTSAGTTVDELRLVYDAADQPQSVLPDGVHMEVNETGISVGSGSSANLPFTIWADNTADAAETLVLKVKSGQAGDETTWGTITIYASFSEAAPVLYFTPTQIVTGVAQDDTAVETVTLRNTGLADFSDVTLALFNNDGSEAPDWVYLNSSEDQGSLAVGQSLAV
ncbi:MAG: hypothetical protein GY867_08480, partial [bacterium]|nr:hypothetical protein [bacterium]